MWPCFALVVCACIGSLLQFDTLVSGGEQHTICHCVLMIHTLRQGHRMSSPCRAIASTPAMVSISSVATRHSLPLFPLHLTPLSDYAHWILEIVAVETNIRSGVLAPCKSVNMCYTGCPCFSPVDHVISEGLCRTCVQRSVCRSHYFVRKATAVASWKNSISVVHDQWGRPMRLAVLAAIGCLLVAVVSAEVIFQEKFDGELLLRSRV